MKKLYTLFALLILATPAKAQSISDSPKNAQVIRSTTVEGVNLNMGADQAQSELLSRGYSGDLKQSIDKGGLAYVTFTKDQNAMGQVLHSVSFLYKSNADRTPIAGQNIMTVNYIYNDVMNQNRMSGGMYNWSGSAQERHYKAVTSSFSVNSTAGSTQVRTLKGNNISDGDGSYDLAATLMPQGRYVVAIRDNKAK